MVALRRKSTFIVGLAAVFVMGLALPGQAAFTKLYRFSNKTGGDQEAVKAITNGLEVITSSWANQAGWAPARVGYVVRSGVYCTKITFSGTPVVHNTWVKLGWTTADGSCRLRDLRWGDGQSIVPAEVGGIPGGGMVFYDYPEPGCLTVVITNDTEGVILLSDVEFAIAGYELSLEELDALDGLVELRVASIDEDIDVLRAEIEYCGATGVLPSPSANSLIRKLDRATAYKHDGLDEYLAGDLDDALTFWAKAAKQMTNFISEVTNVSQKGNLEVDLYDRWIVHGDGEIATAPEMRDALLALPEGQALQSLEPVPCGELPSYPALTPWTAWSGPSTSCIRESSPRLSSAR